MKALSIWQPWASAIAVGAKTIETRSWYTHYRGPLLIHAGKKKIDPVIETEKRRSARIPAGEELPYGAIIAVVELVDCRPVERLTGLSKRERSLGRYEPGWFGWVLRDVRMLPKPIPHRGWQGFFEVSDELLPKVFTREL